MIDLSDGLAGVASHLSAASDVAIRIDLDALPIGPGVRETATSAGEDPGQFAARGGEDYELLAVLPPEVSPGTGPQPGPGIGVRLTRIGEVRAGKGVELTQSGRVVRLAGFDHFA
jgi:thiamine-monophosphate kinase